MRKPQAIGLTVVTAALAGGLALSGTARRSDSGRSAETMAKATQALPEREYQNDEYVPFAGYYHAPYHAFFPYHWNYYDPARGYYHGGLWTAQPMDANLAASKPTSGELQKARNTYVSASGGAPSSSGGSSWHSSHVSSFGRSSSSWGSWHSSSPSSSGTSHASSGSSGSHTSFGGFGSHGSSTSS